MIIHVFDVYAILIYNNMKQKAKDQWIHHKLSVKGISFSKMYDVIIWIIRVSSGREKKIVSLFYLYHHIMNLAFSFWGWFSLFLFAFGFCWQRFCFALFCIQVVCIYVMCVCMNLNPSNLEKNYFKY